MLYADGSQLFLDGSAIESMEADMLVLTRKPRQTILIQPALWLPRDLTAGELFGAGGIGVVVTRVMEGKEVRLGIAADRRFVVWRGELEGWGR